MRRPDALGARIDAAADNPWFDAAVVPADAVPPADDPRLPHCLWTLADAVPGRVEDAGDRDTVPGRRTRRPGVGARRQRAGRGGAVARGARRPQRTRLRSSSGSFGPLSCASCATTAFAAYGLRDRGAFVCVALTMAVGDDVSIQYVATEAGHRRRGLASGLVLAVMAAAQGEGMRSATLQASPDGLSVYQRLGFRRVATLRGICARSSAVRPAPGLHRQARYRDATASDKMKICKPRTRRSHANEFAGSGQSGRCRAQSGSRSSWLVRILRREDHRPSSQDHRPPQDGVGVGPRKRAVPGPGGPPAQAPGDGSEDTGAGPEARPSPGQSRVTAGTVETGRSPGSGHES